MSEFKRTFIVPTNLVENYEAVIHTPNFINIFTHYFDNNNNFKIRGKQNYVVGMLIVGCSSKIKEAFIKEFNNNNDNFIEERNRPYTISDFLIKYPKIKKDVEICIRSFNYSSN